jgi:hypothetical protein
LFVRRQLLHRAPEELVRRVAIIMFEDAMLHPAALVLLTWLTMAMPKGTRLCVTV